MNRRTFLMSGSAILAAPAFCRADWLMPLGTLRYSDIPQVEAVYLVDGKYVGNLFSESLTSWTYHGSSKASNYSCRYHVGDIIQERKGNGIDTVRVESVRYTLTRNHTTSRGDTFYKGELLTISGSQQLCRVDSVVGDPAIGRWTHAKRQEKEKGFPMASITVDSIR